MANALYDKFKEDSLEGVHTLSTNDIRFALIDLADYTFSAAHENLADATVPAAAKVALTTAGVGGKSVTGGVFDADNITWSSVSGDQCEAIIGYIHNAVEANARLIFFLDTSITGMPVTPNGGDITVTWAANIFSL